jgi:hypothetical protein
VGFDFHIGRWIYGFCLLGHEKRDAGMIESTERGLMLGSLARFLVDLDGWSYHPAARGAHRTVYIIIRHHFSLDGTAILL